MLTSTLFFLPYCYLDGFATTEVRLVDHLSSTYFLDWPQNCDEHGFQQTNWQKKLTSRIAPLSSVADILSTQNPVTQTITRFPLF